MKISSQSSTLAISPQSCKENLPMFANAGFEALDFGFCDIYTPAQIYKGEHSDVFDLPHSQFTDYFCEIKKTAEENGMVIGQTHAPFPTQIVNGNKETNAYLKECILKSIEATALMGCKYIVIHPVFGDYYAPLTPEEEHRVNLEFYSSLIAQLKKYGVTACLENMWVSRNSGNFQKIYAAACNDYDEVNLYIKELNEMAGEECFGFCFDSGHAVVVGADVAKAIKTLGKNIKVLHLHDVDGVHDNHTMPYVGVSDWGRILTALNDVGYKGTLNFEASAAWWMFPAAVRSQAINLLGAIGKYFVDTYFSKEE